MSEGETPAVMTCHLRITGRVQGVGYRWSMAQEAKRLGVNGWVRNRLDSSVEAVVSGNLDAVQALLDWAQRGPMGARVDGLAVEVADGNLAAPSAGFEQRPTA